MDRNRISAHLVSREARGSTFTDDCLVVLSQVREETGSQPSLIPGPGSVVPLSEGSQMQLQNTDYVKPRRILHWIVGKELKHSDDSPLTESEKLRWATRCETSILYGSGTVAICTLGAVYYLAFGHSAAAVALFCSVVAILLAMLLLRVALSSTCASPDNALDAFVFMIILQNISFPIILHFLFGGGTETSDVLLWTLLAPLAALFLLHKRPVFYAVVLHIIRTILCFAVLCVDSYLEAAAVESEQGYWTALIVLLFTNFTAPAFIAVAYWRAMDEFRLWHASFADIQTRSIAQQATNSLLLSSLFPPIPAKEEVMAASAPEDWWRLTAPDTLGDCSMLQMDIKGFTSLSSTVSAAELVDLINAIFTSIDEAANIIGHVWKVETIGDCYKAVVGGFEPCDDHAHRATLLACAALEIVHGIATKMELPLTVRCGVHSGSVTGAVVGSVLPRYLVYGTTCDRVNDLEASAEAATVQCSEETAGRLAGTSWVLTERTTWEGRGGGQESEVQERRFEVGLDEASREVMGTCGRKLSKFLKIFRVEGADKTVTGEDKVVTGAGSGDGPCEEVQGVEEELVGGMEAGVREQSLEQVTEGPSAPVKVQANLFLESEEDFKSMSWRGAVAGEGSITVREGLSRMDEDWNRVTRHALFAGPVFSSNRRIAIPEPAGVEHVSMTGAAPPEFARLPTGRANISKRMRRRQRRAEHGGRREVSARSWGVGRLWQRRKQREGQELPEGEASFGAEASPVSRVGSPVRSPHFGRSASRVTLARSESSASWQSDAGDERHRNQTVVLFLLGTVCVGALLHFGVLAAAAVQVGADPELRAASVMSDPASNVPGEQDTGGPGGMEGMPGMGGISDGGVGGTSESDDDEEDGEVKEQSQGWDLALTKLWLKAAGPGGFLALALPTLAVLWRSRSRGMWGGWARAWISVLLLLCPCAFLGSHDRRHLYSSVVWCFFAVLIQARGWGPRNSWRTLLGTLCTYLAFIVVLHLVLSSNSPARPGHASGRGPPSWMRFGGPGGRRTGHNAMGSPPGDGGQPPMGPPMGEGEGGMGGMGGMGVPPGDGNGAGGPTTGMGDGGPGAPGAMGPGGEGGGPGQSGGMGGAGGGAEEGVPDMEGPGAGERENERLFEEFWWVVVLDLVNHTLPAAAFLVPLVLTVQQLWEELGRNKEGVDALQAAVAVQAKLLNALVPAPICRRLMSGEEQRIADSHVAASVLFVYVLDVGRMMAEHGEEKAIAWLNRVFERLDGCVASWSKLGGAGGDDDSFCATERRQGLTKVESFNNFYLAVSIGAGNAKGGGSDDGRHAEAAVAGALAMVEAACREPRPDGTMTTVKAGINSGPLCAGVISMQAPRWSIFGDTVNVASRMASLAAPSEHGRRHVQLSDATACCVSGGTGWDEVRGQGVGLFRRAALVDVKGKGMMQTWSVQGPASAQHQDQGDPDWVIVHRPLAPGTGVTPMSSPDSATLLSPSAASVGMHTPVVLPDHRGRARSLREVEEGARMHLPGAASRVGAAKDFVRRESELESTAESTSSFVTAGRHPA